jgi:hypothetical protein
MKAIRYDRYGPPDVLGLLDLDMPAVGDGEVLIRVRAASLHPLDWHFMRGEPYLVRILAGLLRPKASANGLGADMAGPVEGGGQERHPSFSRATRLLLTWQGLAASPDSRLATDGESANRRLNCPQTIHSCSPDGMQAGGGLRAGIRSRGNRWPV